jgi:hypothetical protein
MGVGKYSPTVSRWYRVDQNWHKKHCEEGQWIDRDGYDSYGYHHEHERDRAGYTELEYMTGEWDGDEYVHPLYEMIHDEWYSAPLPFNKGE